MWRTDDRPTWRWDALPRTEGTGAVVQKGQVQDLFGDEQSVTGTQNRYSQKREKGPHLGAAAGGSTNPGGRMLLCGGVCGCVQVRARSMAFPPPGPALPLVGHLSPSSFSQHHHSHLGAQTQPVYLLPAGRQRGPRFGSDRPASIRFPAPQRHLAAASGTT